MVNSTETGLAGNWPAVPFDRSLGGLQSLQAIEYTKGEQKRGIHLTSNLGGISTSASEIPFAFDLRLIEHRKIARHTVEDS